MIADYGITKTKDIVLVDKRNSKQAWKSPFFVVLMWNLH